MFGYRPSYDSYGSDHHYYRPSGYIQPRRSPYAAAPLSTYDADLQRAGALQRRRQQQHDAYEAQLYAQRQAHARAQAMERQRRLEESRRQERIRVAAAAAAAEEEERHRRYYQRAMEAERQLRQQQQQQAQAEEEQEHMIVRGPHGRLYQVAVPKETRGNHRSQDPQRASPADDSTARMSNTSSSWNSTNHPTKTHEIPRMNVSSTAFGAKRSVGTPSPTPTPAVVVRGDFVAPNGILVEDVTEEETRNDELKSVWRHRVPTEGEWMEPVAVVPPQYQPPAKTNPATTVEAMTPSFASTSSAKITKDMSMEDTKQAADSSSVSSFCSAVSSLSVEEEQQQEVAEEERTLVEDVAKHHEFNESILVEDITEEEMQNDEMNSFWRHLAPGDGEWMEPVDFPLDLSSASRTERASLSTNDDDDNDVNYHNDNVMLHQTNEAREDEKGVRNESNISTVSDMDSSVVEEPSSSLPEETTSDLLATASKDVMEESVAPTALSVDSSVENPSLVQDGDGEGPVPSVVEPNAPDSHALPPSMEDVKTYEGDSINNNSLPHVISEKGEWIEAVAAVVKRQDDNEETKTMVDGDDGKRLDGKDKDRKALSSNDHEEPTDTGLNLEEESVGTDPTRTTVKAAVASTEKPEEPQDDNTLQSSGEVNEEKFVQVEAPTNDPLKSKEFETVGIPANMQKMLEEDGQDPEEAKRDSKSGDHNDGNGAKEEKKYEEEEGEDTDWMIVSRDNIIADETAAVVALENLEEKGAVKHAEVEGGETSLAEPTQVRLGEGHGQDLEGDLEEEVANEWHHRNPGVVSRKK